MSNSNSAVAGGQIGTRWAARLAGALIILSYLSYGLPNGIFVQPLVTATDPLAAIAANGTQLTVAALLMAINSAAIIGIALFLYPIVKRHSESIALAYVVTRTFESLVMIAGIIGLLVLVPVSQAAVQGGAADAATMGALSAFAVHGNAMAYRIAMISLSVGSIPFCYLLYRARLVPRVLPVLGVVGYLALSTMMVVETLGGGVDPIVYLLYVPGMLFEIGLACWLLVKGLDTAETSIERAASFEGEPAE